MILSDFLEYIRRQYPILLDLQCINPKRQLNDQFEFSFNSNQLIIHALSYFVVRSSQEEKAQVEQIHHPSDHRSYVDQVDSAAYSVENIGYIKRQGSRFEFDELDPGSYRRVEEGRSESLRDELRSGERARE